MSRSYRRTPIFGITVAETEKQDKRRANRKWRRLVHQFLGADPEREVLPAQREVSDVKRGTTRSAFARQALRLALRQLKAQEKEQYAVSGAVYLLG